MRSFLLSMGILCLLGGMAVAQENAAMDDGFDSDVNTVRADLAEAAKRDFSLYHNDIFPGMLLHTNLKSLYLFRELAAVGLSAPTHMAWKEGGQVKVARIPAQTGAKLDAPWVVVWFNGGKGWGSTIFTKGPWVKNSKQFSPEVGPIDCPWLIVLQKPGVVKLDDQGLSIEGQSSLGYVVAMPLYGSAKLRPAQTAAWARELPKDVVERAERWAAISRKFPLYAKEDYQVDEQSDQVRIRNSFEYLDIADDWGTKPQLVAPVPPVVALAAKWRVSFEPAVTDLDMVTHWGPYAAAMDTSSFTYTISGVLKYIDEVESVKKLNTSVAGFPQVQKLLLERIQNAARGGADPRGAYSIDWGMGMLGAWMRSMKYLPKDLQDQLSGYIKRENLLNGFFLADSTYQDVSVNVGKRKLDVLVRRAKEGLQTYGDDLVKQTSRMPYVVWQYGYYSKDWDSVKAKYDFVKKMYGFNLLLGWSNVGPEYTAEHAKISAKQGPIGLARLAKQFGDQETYDYGAYLLAKALLNEWVWDVSAVPYIKAHTPWFHPDNGEWIMHENHGYVGLECMPVDQMNTYQEIPLILDRFNREELADFNDFYVRMRHRYFPTAQLGNVYVSDLGDAPSLKALYTKPLTALVSPAILKSQSHLSPIFYNYPVDLMELGSQMQYERLYPKGDGQAAWRRGLDSLSRGQSWRQMAIAIRKEWDYKGGTSRPWPYPGWYMMNPPQKSPTFHDDLLPFGFIQADLTRQPKNWTSNEPNWNSSLSSCDVN